MKVVIEIYTGENVDGDEYTVSMRVEQDGKVLLPYFDDYSADSESDAYNEAVAWLEEMQEMSDYESGQIYWV